LTGIRCKVLILGGYGTFGGRLAELLSCESALTLVIAGRSEAEATAFCERLPPGAGREAQAVDRDTDLERRLSEITPNIVVDASGPFQAYGDDPYRVVKAALAVGCHYLDFADGSDFVRGISRFDEAARQSGSVVLSGVSSFPVLTAAVVRHLSSDLDRVDSITGGIAPSPYAGVGLNVIRAVAGYAGQKVSVRRQGEDSIAYALTETRRYTIAPPGCVPLNSIEFSLVDVPDLQLLTDLWPEVQSVWMGVAPVPAVLHRMLRWLARSVRYGVLPSLEPFARIFFHSVNFLRWGEHRGGMFVEIEGRETNGRSIKRSWHLVAEGDDGPFIPSMAIEAIIRNWVNGQKPSAGARAALEELEVSDYEKLFSKRQIFTATRWLEAAAGRCLYERLLGEAWHTLPKTLKALHSASPRLQMGGKATVTRGTGVLARAVARIFDFPHAADSVDVTVTFHHTNESEFWNRNFGGQTFSSIQYEGQGRYQSLLCEQFGPFVFGMALVRDSNRVRFVVRRWSIFAIPLPRRLAPTGDSFEFEEEGVFRFHVEVRSPIAGLIVRYAGYLERL
jgi:hypothetical protein